MEQELDLFGLKVESCIGADTHFDWLDAKDFDMVYYYESQLQGEAAPAEDIHFHPVHPQTFVLNLKAKF